MGGPRRAASSSVGGRVTARGLGGFLSAVTTAGIHAAARQFGLAEFLSRGTRVLLARLVDTISPEGVRGEDVAARAALTRTLENLNERLEMEADGVDALNRLTPDQIPGILIEFVTNYVYELILVAFADHIETRSMDAGRVRELEREARDYLEEAVRVDLPARMPELRDPATLVGLQWDGAEGRKLVNSLFTECYSVLEADL